MTVLDVIIAIISAATAFLTGLAAVIGALAVISSKFRNFLVNSIYKTDKVQEFVQKVDQLQDNYSSIDKRLDIYHEDIDNIDKKLVLLEQYKIRSDRAIVAGIRYEILDICHRARRYDGITVADKEVLCDLHNQYINIWKQNHYVDSEAQYIINNFPIVDNYYDNEVK